MKHELLAPAGNLQVFYAVINAGADAVYIGGPKFGARAYAKNFTEEEILIAIQYAHLHHVRVYMTVNTLIKNSEMQACIDMMIPFYEAGLDGVIVQDIGVLKRFAEEFPQMELHSSTQMSISNVTGAKLLKANGVTRVVTSRELSLKEINHIRNQAGIEVECFIHGALCYCYSGQCLLSSVIGGRSGNRGRCAQPCRLPYETMDLYGKKIKDSSEILSLKDLCTIDFLPDLLDAGIDSLKIEGRMKQASYAYTVVKIYRKYLDYYLKHGKEGYHVLPKDRQLLLQAGNRDGFTDGYYYRHNGPEMITTSGSAHNSNAGQVEEELICQPQKIGINAKAVLREGTSASFTLNYQEHSVTVTYGQVQQAQKSAMTEEKIRKQLTKTGNTNFDILQLEIDMQDSIFISVSELNELRRKALEQLTDNLCSHRVYVSNKKEKQSERSFENEFSTSVLAQTEDQIRRVLNRDSVQRIYIEAIQLLEGINQELIDSVLQHKKELYLALPYVFREDMVSKLDKAISLLVEKHQIHGFLVRSYDEIIFAQKYSLPLIADQWIYTYSDDAKEMAKHFGMRKDTIPFELSKQEIRMRNNKDSELLVYGRIPLMITASCVHKNTLECKKQSGFLTLKDRKGYIFPIQNVCQACYNVMYNSLPTCLFNKKLSMNDLKVRNVRLSFTTETPEEVDSVCDLFEANILNTSQSKVCLSDFTWGHFNRGVE